MHLLPTVSRDIARNNDRVKHCYIKFYLTVNFLETHKTFKRCKISEGL